MDPKRVMPPVLSMSCLLHDHFVSSSDGAETTRNVVGLRKPLSAGAGGIDVHLRCVQSAMTCDCGWLVSVLIVIMFGIELTVPPARSQSLNAWLSVSEM